VEAPDFRSRVDLSWEYISGYPVRHRIYQGSDVVGWVYRDSNNVPGVNVSLWEYRYWIDVHHSTEEMFLCTEDRTVLGIAHRGAGLTWLRLVVDGTFSYVLKYTRSEVQNHLWSWAVEGARFRQGGPPFIEFSGRSLDSHVPENIRQGRVQIQPISDPFDIPELLAFGFAYIVANVVA